MERESLGGETSGSKWMKQLIFLLLFLAVIGLVCLLGIMLRSDFRTAMRTAASNVDKVQMLLKHFNVSQEQIQYFASLLEADEISSLTCSKQRGRQISSNSFTCALKLLSSTSGLVEQSFNLVEENCKHIDQCPAHDDNNSKDLDLQFLKMWYSSSVNQDHQLSCEDTLHTKPQAKFAINHFRVILTFANISWFWILIGIVSSTQILKFWRNQKKNSVQQQLTDPPQLLQPPHPPNRSSSRSTGSWRRKFLVIGVCFGISICIWLFWYLSKDHWSKNKEMLTSMCDERARMLQDQFNVSLNHVHALAILVSSFYHEKESSVLNQKTFEAYTEKTAFERPLTSGVAYALRVLHSMRENFEKQQGWKIRKMDTEDQTLSQDLVPENLEPSPVQEEYAPVIFAQKTVSHIVSIDMMSGKEDRENILRARASGKGVLTSPFKLLKSNHLGVVLTFAVYNTDLPPDAAPQQRVNATVGYLGASYDVPSLVEKLLHQLASKQTIVVHVYDTTNKSSPIKMYGEDVVDTGLLRISNLDFGDPARKHEMHCRFKQKPPLPWTVITSSGGVLVITFLLGHIFRAAINEIDKVEDDYHEMMELKHRAEAADVAKSQFLATVSHEIRTPMNGVLGMLQMLMDTNLDDIQRDYAETAHASGKDLIALINEVLDQAKIESGRLELEAAPFDLRADLDKILSLLSGKSHEKEIELAVYVSDQVPQVVIGDPGRFRQIIMNLVGNSIKFTKDKDKGHIFVTVHLADEVGGALNVRDEILRQSLILAQDGPVASSNTLSGFPIVDRWKSWENFKSMCGTRDESGKIKLLVTVEDTGEGIPVEAQDRIFTPFMQADSSTSRTHGGTGIGLSISKRLVDLMGGEIGFVSERGIGSTFSFTVTFSKPEHTPVDIAHLKLHNEAVSVFRGLKALVVDERGFRGEVTRYHLKRLGVQVDVASGTDSACSYISYVKKRALEPLDMIVIDKEYWASEGYHPLFSLLKGLRSIASTSNLERAPTPKLFLLATSTTPSDQIEFKSSGLVDSVLIKPLRLSALLSSLQEATGFGGDSLVRKGKPPTLGNLLANKHILVVDDNTVNRRVAEAALKKYGAIVTCVGNGMAALKLLDPPHNFDACFMDLQMPLMDGFEATEQIRDLERKYNDKSESCELPTPILANISQWHTPILAMTADVSQATNEKCIKCGMDGYVSKPFEEGQLYSAVARFFECD
ncbi:OLC1v1024630C1 [Oldenlandia corymbosa var. corymbosa]|uniref:histidine kinase n=1 Tax=Oldenlandia corymbosa var. corymbosa TaxID=529605 RepID=A0AAV1C6A8_OLDCO|nr:OLC1v1024630C1 [Oldenlandia corymbosa var. corymbosa]